MKYCTTKKCQEQIPLIHRGNQGASKVNVKSIGYLKNHTITDLVVIILC